MVRGPVLCGKEAGGGNHPEGDVQGRQVTALRDGQVGRELPPAQRPRWTVMPGTAFRLRGGLRVAVGRRWLQSGGGGGQ